MRWMSDSRCNSTWRWCSYGCRCLQDLIYFEHLWERYPKKIPQSYPEKVKMYKQRWAEWVSQKLIVALHLSAVIRPRMRGLSLLGLGWQWERAAPDDRQGRKSLEQPLVIQQEWLMIMDGPCFLWLNSPLSCNLLPSLHSSSIHPFSSLFLCYFMYSKFPIPSRFPAGLQVYQQLQ